MDAIRVMVVDDHPVVRQGLRSLLTQYDGIEVVGEAEDGPTALRMIGEVSPDVVLLDVRLANQNGLDFVQQLRRAEPRGRIVVLTSHDDRAYLLKAAHSGVHGYLLKSASAEVLVEAIHAVSSGERRLSPTVAGKALEQLEELSQQYVQAESGLSDQELQMLKLLAKGASTREMSNALYLSDRTIKRKIQEILTKLDAANRAQAVAEAFKRGLL